MEVEKPNTDLFIKQYPITISGRGPVEHRSPKGSYFGGFMTQQTSNPHSGNFQAQQPQPNLRHTTAFFDLPNPSQGNNFGFNQQFHQPLTQSSTFNSGNYQQYPSLNQNQAAQNFNIFEFYQNQAQNQPQNQQPQMRMNTSSMGMPYNNPIVPDPHQSLFIQPFQNIPGIPRGSLNQSPLKSRSQIYDPFILQRKPNWENSDDNGVKQHEKIEEETILNESKFKQMNGADPFHGKSIRSIQLFNQPTAASPHLLHPRQNPLVKVDSPRAKPLAHAPARTGSNLLDIHADSCYNFLNKRRFKLPEDNLTPLESFFLKESQNQYKVAVALGRKMVNLAPAKRPPIRRTKRYLLVLDIDETLVHSEPIIANNKPTENANKQYDKSCRFDNGDGTFDVYGVKFRPYLQDFIKRLAKLYDLAVYTASARDYADAVMDCLDPARTIFCARLYRDHCVPVNGMNIKNMANFDGQEVFIVDNLIYSYAYHMTQGIPICAFVDDPMDVELHDLAEILENLPYYETLPALLQDLLGLDEFYQVMSLRMNSAASYRSN